MRDRRLQIISVGGEYGKITTVWLLKTEKPKGRQIFYHPDCEIWVSGRNTVNVQHVIMQSLQCKNMRVRELLFVKGGFK